VKVNSSEYLLLAAVVEAAVRTHTLPNLLLFRCCTCFLLVLLRLLLIDLALILDGKFISLYGYIEEIKLFSHDLSSSIYLFCCCATIVIQEYCH